MKKVITASSSNKYIRRIVDEFESAGDQLDELLGKYASIVSLSDKGILSEEELKQIGEVADMLHEAAHYLASE